MSSKREPMRMTFWSGPNERVIIRFKNGNLYEGDVSMKCMHGQGRFQWADGTVYMGNFVENCINGQGEIHWSNDTWYTGEFVGNLRHGRGLYVDSRRQQCYSGEWYSGTKNGNGLLSYSGTFDNTYEGEWVQNIREGIGSRQYCASSVYYGDWAFNRLEGYGLMIWPNQNVYIGEWSNNKLSGFGKYMWDMYNNKYFALQAIQYYQGFWKSGHRLGFGITNFGFRNGSYYEGKFEDNMKHGPGKLVLNNGLTIGDNTSLFKHDVIRKFPYSRVNFTSETVDVSCHVREAVDNIGREDNFRGHILNKFFENNLSLNYNKFKLIQKASKGTIEFEVRTLRNAVKHYELVLHNIYELYATVCNAEIQTFPVLIRLFLWQFYYDCNMIEKGLTLVQIDNMVAAHPNWLVNSAHDPFEIVYFWQFLHVLILLSRYFYVKSTLPGPKPDNIMGCAFRHFMENDVLPNYGNNKGSLVRFGEFLPLEALYQLYRSLGEPHTVRTFLCAIRDLEHVFKSSEYVDTSIVEAKSKCLPFGHNIIVFGNVAFIMERKEEPDCYEGLKKLKLFNLGNLSSQNIIKVFADIFPTVFQNNHVLDLDIEMTFFEFFEGFVGCNKLSIQQFSCATISTTAGTDQSVSSPRKKKLKGVKSDKSHAISRPA